MSSSTLFPRSRYICRLCSQSMRQPTRQRRPWSAPGAISLQAVLHPRPVNSIQWRAASTAAPTPHKTKGRKSFWENEWTIYSADNAQLVRKAQAFSNEVLNSKSIPDEETTMKAMKVIQFAASQLVRPVPKLQQVSKEERIEAPPGLDSGLLSLDSKPAHPISISISIDLLSTLAYRLITYPPVFITAPILASYVSTQSALHRPATFPEVFELYATKAVPIPGSSPLKYKNPNPRASSQAIPENVANDALQAAIKAKDLHLALSIIETSYALPSFQRRKFLTKAAPGLTALSLAPVAALILATQLPAFSPAADPTSLTAVAFASILTYVGVVSTLGFVAITTRNDQMERVTWVTGTELRARWLREEERAALDRVAMAWGFQDISRRGEEEGDEWEELKEWCGLKGMILDRVELMEGME